MGGQERRGGGQAADGPEAGDAGVPTQAYRGDGAASTGLRPVAEIPHLLPEPKAPENRP